MDQKKLSVTEHNIINRMKSSKNKDGFYEMVLSDKVKERNFSIKSLTNQFEDKAFCMLLKTLYAESGTKASFKKKILVLVQMSLKEKLLSGKVTYKFIQETADLADNKWLKTVCPLKKAELNCLWNIQVKLSIFQSTWQTLL